jgi:hypothetical protein
MKYFGFHPQLSFGNSTGIESQLLLKAFTFVIRMGDTFKEVLCHFVELTIQLFQRKPM